METFTFLGFEVSGGMQLASLFIGLIATVANCKLFVKAGLSWWAVLVPVYNIMVAMRIVGRPSWHAFLFFTPLIVYMLPKTIIEVAQSFGKHTYFDYALAIFFNLFYVLNLGLSYDEDYEGPVYGQTSKKASIAKSNDISQGGMKMAH